MFLGDDLTSQLMHSFIVIAQFSVFTFNTAQLFYPYRFAELANPWSVVYHRPIRAFLMKTDFEAMRGMLIDVCSLRQDSWKAHEQGGGIPSEKRPY